MTGTLRVYFRDEPCGILREDRLGQLQFEYLQSWLEEGRLPVSATLPITKKIHGHAEIAPLVANLLPEGGDLRQRLERLLHVGAEHDFGLLAAIGRECAGALSFWGEDESPEANRPAYVALDLLEFERWRAIDDRLPFQSRGHPIRLSLAGVQSKTALYFDQDDRPLVPENGAATTHILKPRIHRCRPSTVFVELLCMELARAVLGLSEVPETDVWQGCYRIRRFDRPRIEDRVERLHQEDFCLALGRMPEGKYESGSPRERLLAPCFRLIDALGEQGLILAPALERQRLLNLVILNVLLHNPDAHLKNYALVYDMKGHAKVAPLYDCLCTAGLRFGAGDGAWDRDAGLEVHTRELSLRIGDAIFVDAVDPIDWEMFAAECGFTAAFVRRRLRALADALAAALPTVAEDLLNTHPHAEPAVKMVMKSVSAQIQAGRS